MTDEMSNKDEDRDPFDLDMVTNATGLKPITLSTDFADQLKRLQDKKKSPVSQEVIKALADLVARDYTVDRPTSWNAKDPTWTVCHRCQSVTNSNFIRFSQSGEILCGTCTANYLRSLREDND